MCEKLARVQGLKFEYRKDHIRFDVSDEVLTLQLWTSDPKLLEELRGEKPMQITRHYIHPVWKNGKNYAQDKRIREDIVQEFTDRALEESEKEIEAYQRSQDIF